MKTQHRLRNQRRWMVGATLFTLAILLVVRLSLFGGLLGIVRVSGGSMAETYVGEHVSVHCRDCHFTFRIDAVARGHSSRTCPNCGYVNATEPSEAIAPGQRVIVDRWPILSGRIRRLDVIAFKELKQKEAPAIKRIVGLPGERVSIRDGDLYINEELFRKSYRQFQELAIFVHDDRFRPRVTAGAPSRWQAARSESSWQRTENGYQFESQPEDDHSDVDGRWEWLEYRQWPGYQGVAPRFEATSIRDNDAYNHSLSRSLQRVADIGVLFRLRCTARAEVNMQLRSRDDIWELRLRCDDVGGELYRNGVLADKFKSSAFRAGKLLSVEFAICDQQLFFAAQGELILQHIFHLDTLHSDEIIPQVTIGAFRFSDRPTLIELDNVKIQRDIHYLGLPGSETEMPPVEPLGQGCYYVLGDNPPCSLDSRQWFPGAVRIEQVLGRVTKRGE